MITSAAPTLCPSLPYAGEVTPREAWEMLSQAPAARLVDVRTPAEWMFVGGPSLSSLGKRAILIPWKLYPNFENNPRFLEQLQNEAPDKAAPLLFLCRSGGRSLDAA